MLDVSFKYSVLYQIFGLANSQTVDKTKLYANLFSVSIGTHAINLFIILFGNVKSYFNYLTVNLNYVLTNYFYLLKFKLDF